MKLCTFQSRNDSNGPARVGLVLAGEAEVLDLAAAEAATGATASGHFASMLALIDGGEAALAGCRALAEAPRASAVLPLDGLRLLAPIPEPRQIRDCLVFEEHLQNCLVTAEKMTGQKGAIPPVWYEQPIYYKANRFSVVGPGHDVVWPAYSSIMDYELELACVIGRTGVDIPAERSAEHIFGYTIFNDCSARDAQLREMAGQLGPAKGKDFDTGNVFGPWIVTADEIGDPYALAMEVRVNGERRGGGNSRAMQHRFDAILAHISASETIHAGEIVCSGTVGTGCGLEIGRFPEAGDVVTLEIEKIGILENRFVRR
ncbi:fumarylacetoacetate hydrolase family protein [Oceanibacterium hippocampi]|uniref:Ureidoglycolate lyase n=1 Tax=Oceanibacterium hippocampi TaxID=745714 RepID=A0A1Y5TY23_9PROT|nr:fumarylacetoacetate hydrolase family protein [Oceanibacterium hippocampi]SLN76305.1 Ureidoglycolate lyase [Oceanibacterium hippocampi]